MSKHPKHSATFLNFLSKHSQTFINIHIRPKHPEHPKTSQTSLSTPKHSQTFQTVPKNLLNRCLSIVYGGLKL
jgi:hypothetical protein